MNVPQDKFNLKLAYCNKLVCKMGRLEFKTNTKRLFLEYGESRNCCGRNRDNQGKTFPYL